MENTWTKLCICKGKKLAWYLYEKKVTDNKDNLYQIYEFKIIVYDMKLKWIILIDIIIMIMRLRKKKSSYQKLRDAQVKLNLSSRFL